jgi:hypothetical protein
VHPNLQAALRRGNYRCNACLWIQPLTAVLVPNIPPTEPVFMICNRCGHLGTLTPAGTMRHMTAQELQILESRPWFPQMKAHQEWILARLVG